jgi:hypothetical protein
VIITLRKGKRVMRVNAVRNPLRGEWWIDDSGNAQFADGDVGDMNHEMVVIDGLTRTFLNALDIDLNDEYFGTLDNYQDNIEMVMKEEGEEGDWEDFVREQTRHLFPKGVRGDRQHECAFATVLGRSDARNYGLEFQGWIRVHGNNIQTYDMNKEVLGRIGDGISDADQELEPTEEFNIEVNKTGKFYRNVPLEVINAGDPGSLRLYEE